jgi:X-Pro dipeptidyl-peptidase
MHARRSRSIGREARNRRPAATLGAAILALLGAAGLARADDAPKASHRIEDGMAQVVPEFRESGEWVRQELWVEAGFDSDEDGKPDRMHVDVTRPKQTDTEGLKVPAVYISSPYFAGTAGSGNALNWDVRQELGAPPPPRAAPPEITLRLSRPIMSREAVDTWVPRGFAVVHSSSPGTGLSQGCVTVGGDNESLAPKAVIDWLNGRAKGFATPDGDEPVTAGWCTGKVGMTGTSYNGTLALAAATTGVDGLEAIIPIAPNTSYYHYYRSHGLVRSPGGYLGEDIDVLYDFVRSGNPGRRAFCDCSVRDTAMAQQMDRRSGDYNAFWAGRDYLNDLAPLKAATLMSHAFNDWNVMPEHSVRIYEALKARGVPSRIYFHQGGHGGGPPLDHMNKWFTRYLLGVANGVEDEPRAWVVREGDDRGKPTPYPEYPHPGAEAVRLRPTPGAPKLGGLAPDGPDAAAPRGTETLVDNVSFDGSTLAKAEWTNHRLLYATPTLAGAVHLSGTPRLTIKVAASKPAANLSAWLVALPWEAGPQAKITDNIITRGWADPQNARSRVEGRPLTPGEFVELRFDLQPDDQVIPAGQRIALMIFSSDREFTLWPEPGTELTVDLDATSLELPVVGGAKALEGALSGAAKADPAPAASD